MSFNKIDELKNKYDEILDLVIEKLEDPKRIQTFKETYTNENLEKIISRFCKILESDNNKLFKYFLKRRSKIFSNKYGLFIIPSINLEPILNNDGAYLWECVQLIYAINRTGDETKKDNVQDIVDSIEKFNLDETSFNEEDSDEEVEEIEVEVPKETKKVDNIVMDIADTLRNNMVISSKGDEKVNPIENMLKTSQMISDKYGKKIKSGQISMNDMFESLGRMMGEIDKKTSNDEELKNVNLDEMPNPEDMMSQLGVDMNGFNPMDILGSMLNKKNDSQELTPEQIKEMEDFYANVKSEDLKGDDKSSQLENMNNSLMDKLPDDKKQQFMEMTKNLMSSIGK